MQLRTVVSVLVVWSISGVALAQDAPSSREEMMALDQSLASSMRYAQLLSEGAHGAALQSWSLEHVGQAVFGEDWASLDARGRTSIREVLAAALLEELEAAHVPGAASRVSDWTASVNDDRSVEVKYTVTIGEGEPQARVLRLVRGTICEAGAPGSPGVVEGLAARYRAERSEGPHEFAITLYRLTHEKKLARRTRELESD